jgi:hypothetical protein
MFWAAIGGCLYGTWVLFKLGNWAWPFPLIFGPLLTRVIFEKLLITFQIYDRIKDIHEEIKKGQARAFPRFLYVLALSI